MSSWLYCTPLSAHFSAKRITGPRCESHERRIAFTRSEYCVTSSNPFSLVLLHILVLYLILRLPGRCAAPFTRFALLPTLLLISYHLELHVQWSFALSILIRRRGYIRNQHTLVAISRFSWSLLFLDLGQALCRVRFHHQDFSLSSAAKRGPKSLGGRKETSMSGSARGEVLRGPGSHVAEAHCVRSSVQLSARYPTKCSLGSPSHPRGTTHRHT